MLLTEQFIVKDDYKTGGANCSDPKTSGKSTYSHVNYHILRRHIACKCVDFCGITKTVYNSQRTFHTHVIRTGKFNNAHLCLQNRKKILHDLGPLNM